MKRERYLDVLKGFGIFLVVLGHSSIPMVIKQWIYIFHMPLFFFISGYINRYDTKNVKDSFIYNVKKLLYPYCVIGILIIGYNTLIDLLSNHVFSGIMFVKRILALLYGNCIWENNYDYIGTLWFLAALFMVKTIYSLISKIKNVQIRYSIVLIIILVGCLWIKIFETGIRLPFCLDVALLAFAFYAIGKCPIFHNSKSITSNAVLLYSATMILGSILGLLNCHISQIERTDIYGMCIGNPILYYVSYMMIIRSLMFLTKYFCRSIDTFIGKFMERAEG